LVRKRRHRRLLLVAAPAFVAAVGVGLVTALALSPGSGSAAGPGSGSGVAVRSGQQPSTSAATPRASAPATATPSRPRKSEPGPPSPPPRTSGGLTARTLPPARSLGAAWGFRVDEGSAEAGYVGNGTPTLARDPREIVMTVLPLGCEQRTHLPTPSHALETDYRQRAQGIAGVGIRLRFATAAAAGRFVSTRRSDLRACATQPREPADLGLRLVSGLRETGQGTYVSVRTDPLLAKADRTWTEVAGWLGGHDVVLLAVNATPDSTLVDVTRLSSAVRGVLR
jgi:hypothetical protein